MTTKHPNAHILQRLAEIAQTTPRPYEHFEWDYAGKQNPDWSPCDHNTEFLHPALQFRERILNPITINGKTLEGPMREVPEFNTDFWLLFDDSIASPQKWVDDYSNKRWLKEGRVFRTRSACDAMQTELTKLLTGGK